MGHSSGEIAAAYAVGAISKQSAWKVAYFRGLVSSKLANDSSGVIPRGSMMAVGASESQVRPYIERVLNDTKNGVLIAACSNSPKSTTLSGDENLIQEVQAILEKEGHATRLLRVPVAYHSPRMLHVATPYRKLIDRIDPGEPPVSYAPMVSSVTGNNIAHDDLLRSDYWVKNLVSPVCFSDAMRHICRNSSNRAKRKLDLSHRESVSITNLIEIGPHSALQGPVRDAVQAWTPPNHEISYCPTLVRGKSGTHTILEAAGRLLCCGFRVNLVHANNVSGTHGGSFMTLPHLPEYPFDHSQTFWYEPRISKNLRLPFQQYNTEFLGLPVADWNPLEPRWRNNLKISSIPWLGDHKVMSIRRLMNAC